MTAINQRMRDAIKKAEVGAANALASQPEDDTECEVYLFNALTDIFCELSGAVADYFKHAKEVLDEHNKKLDKILMKEL